MDVHRTLNVECGHGYLIKICNYMHIYIRYVYVKFDIIRMIFQVPDASIQVHINIIYATHEEVEVGKLPRLTSDLHPIELLLSVRVTE